MIDTNLQKLNEIREKIHTINPDITDELLNLLYEYTEEKKHINLLDTLNNPNLKKEFNKVTSASNRLITE